MNILILSAVERRDLSFDFQLAEGPESQFVWWIWTRRVVFELNFWLNTLILYLIREEISGIKPLTGRTVLQPTGKTTHSPCNPH